MEEVDLQTLVLGVHARRRSWRELAITAIKGQDYNMCLLLEVAERHAIQDDAQRVYDVLQAINDLECNSTGDCTVAGDATEQLRELLGIED